MSPTLERLREEILALPAEQRESLIASVSENREVVPLGLHPDWEAELDRRMQNFHDGKCELISEEDMERELEENSEPSVKLSFHPEARQDQREATAWYRKESKELVRRLLDERSAVLKRIKDAPQQFPFVGVRRQQALMTVFPYKIIFEQMPGFILIVAIAHTSRKPDYWSNRSL